MFQVCKACQSPLFDYFSVSKVLIRKKQCSCGAFDKHETKCPICDHIIRKIVFVFNYKWTVIKLLYKIQIIIERQYTPVHMMSIPGNNLAPMVVRYSDVATFGTARVAQYSVGQKRNLGCPRYW